VAMGATERAPEAEEMVVLIVSDNMILIALRYSKLGRSPNSTTLVPCH
jgi:hypothetical protein